MSIIPALATQFQSLYPATVGGHERWWWFVLTLQAILVPITASRNSNLLRAIGTLFGVRIAPSRYDTFMASAKLRWAPLLGDPLAGDSRATHGRALTAGVGRCHQPQDRTQGLRLSGHLRSHRQDQSKPVSLGADHRHRRLAEAHPRPLELSAVSLRFLFASEDLTCRMPPGARPSARLSDQVRPSGAVDRAPGEHVRRGTDPGRHRLLVRQPGVAQAVTCRAGAALAVADPLAGQHRAPCAPEPSAKPAGATPQVRAAVGQCLRPGQDPAGRGLRLHPAPVRAGARGNGRRTAGHAQDAPLSGARGVGVPQDPMGRPGDHRPAADGRANH